MANTRPDFKLIVGLGNPGDAYRSTRHNVGFWFADRAAAAYCAAFSFDAKSFGEISRAQRGALDARILKPDTFMNLSGKSVQAVCSYFKLSPDQILVAHDELDLPPGVVKIKNAGGHGGHNGLRDISRILGEGYWRLRIGIGHPGHRDRVSSWVLSRPARDQESDIEAALDRVMLCIDELLVGDFALATQQINTRPPTRPVDN